MDKGKESLFKEIKDQIKDIVINRFLELISTQSKKVIELTKENEMLKANLTFILKKVMLSKRQKKSTNDYINTNRSFRSYLQTQQKPTNSFQYTPTEYNNLNNTMMQTDSRVDTKVNDYITTLYRRSNYVANNRHNYLLYKSSSSLYDDIFATERRNNSNSSYLFTDSNIYNGLNKHNSQRQISSMSMSKKASLNRISYHNLSMRNINSHNHSLVRDEKKGVFSTPRITSKRHCNLGNKGSSGKKNFGQTIDQGTNANASVNHGKKVQQNYKIKIRQRPNILSPSNYKKTK